MSGKVLFACSKCFSRHPFEELSSGTQLCKSCRGSISVVKCSYCRSEFQPISKSQNICKKCEHNLSKYGKPSACECCKIVAAFGGSKCVRCASYEARYGPPAQCDECKLKSAFDRRDENRKINGKLLCWLCTCAYKRAYLKAQQEGRISSKKRPHEKTQRDSSSAAKKPARPDITKASSGNSGVSAVSAAGLDMPEKISRTGSQGSGNGSMGLGSIAAPAVVSIDPNSSDHVVAMTTLKERIASLEKRLSQKDKELLEKDKLLTELKGKNFEKEIEMRNKLKDIDRLNEMKVDNLNRKVAALLKEVAMLKKSNKKNNVGGNVATAYNKEKEKVKRERENVSPKDEIITACPVTTESSDKDDEKDDAKEEMKSEEDSRDSRVSTKEETKTSKVEEEIKDDEKREEREESVKSEKSDKSEKSTKSEKSAKSENSETNKEEENDRSRSRSRSGSRSVSRSPSRSKSRSQSRSRSRSQSQSRSRSGSRSHSGTRSPSGSRSNTPDSN